MPYFGAMKKYIYSILSVFCLQTSLGQEKSLPIDQLKLVLELDLNPTESSLNAKVSIDCMLLTSTDSIWLDGVQLSYSSFKWNGNEHPYQFNENGLWFKPGEVDRSKKHNIEIEYAAQPRKGIYFRGWNNADPNPQIWTQGQGIDHRHWIPHQDDQRDKVSTEIVLDFPSEYEVVSNGILLPSTQKAAENSKHWHYRLAEAHPSYLIFLGIGKYNMKWDEKEGQIFQHLLYPEHKALFQENYNQTADLFVWMQEAIGVKFPWTATYKHIPVANFKHGAMENTSAVAMGDFFLQDSMILYADRTQLEIQAHEMAHHWFGNSVTALNSSHHWLHEGFATYWQWEAKKQFESDFLYRLSREQAAQRVFSQSANKPCSVSDEKAGSVAFYDKGGWVVSMLKEYVGEEVFKEGIIDFLKANEYGVVQASDLLTSMDKDKYEIYQDFFDYWVEGAGEPELGLKLVGKKNKQSIEIYNPSKAPMRLELLLVHADGRLETQFLRLGSAENLNRLDLEGRDLLAAFPDVDLKCLAKWEMAPLEEKALKQLLKLENPEVQKYLLRYYPSALTLGKKDIEKSLQLKEVDFIWTVLNALPTSNLKEEMLLQLCGIDSLRFLVDMYFSQNTNTSEWSVKLAEKLWENPSYKSKETALSIWFQKDPKLCVAHARLALDYNEPVVKNLKVAASTYLLLKGDEAGKAQLIALALPQNEFNTRGMALSSMTMKGKGVFDQEVLEGCLQDYFDPNGRIARPTRDYVHFFLKDGTHNSKVEQRVKQVYETWTDNQQAVFDRLSGWKK